ncbi:MAG: ATP-dependent RecD-like DNA helicase [Polyangiales bacterium]
MSHEINRDPAAAPVQLTGEVLGQIYQDEAGRFAILRLRTPSAPEPVTVLGAVGHLHPGEEVVLDGHWESHPRHGRRLRATHCRRTPPSHAAAIERLLASRAIPGVGPALAGRLVARFGDRTLEVIRHESGRLREIEGLGTKRIAALHAALKEHESELQTLTELTRLGLGPRLAERLWQAHGGQAMQALERDPYRTAMRIAGIGFGLADSIAQQLGVPPDSPARGIGATLHALGSAADEGHVYLDITSLQAHWRSLGLSAATEAATEAALASLPEIRRDEDRIYLAALHRAEVALAAAVRVRLHRTATGRQGSTDASATTHEPTLSPQQQAAVAMAGHAPLALLTGGPGTGKTTTVRAIVQRAQARGEQVLLCAPTGRAAKRLQDITQMQAQTVHRALEFNPWLKRFQRNQSHPLRENLVLADEASMLDLPLAHRLLDAVAPTARMVWVGDVDQLPPVGPGQPLRDLLSLPQVPVVHLSTVFRQAAHSDIVRAAHAVGAGRMPDFTPAGRPGPGPFYHIEVHDPDEAAQRLRSVMDRIQPAFAFDPVRDTQVLCPMHRGPLGTQALNRLLQRHLNADALAASSDAVFGFAAGDKVMQLRNDYEREVFNGDLGRVCHVDRRDKIVHVDFESRIVRYAAKQLSQLDLAYATTVHKAQGSEYPVVVLMLHRSHYALLSRALLYTAITRGKSVVISIGEKAALRMAIERHALVHNRSHLCARIALNLPAPA